MRDGLGRFASTSSGAGGRGKTEQQSKNYIERERMALVRKSLAEKDAKAATSSRSEKLMAAKRRKDDRINRMDKGTVSDVRTYGVRQLANMSGRFESQVLKDLADSKARIKAYKAKYGK